MEEKIKIKIEKFIEKIKKIFGERLKSCILYGSSVKGNYIEGISDINILVIVDNLMLDDLEKLKRNVSKYAYKNFIKVFYFSEWFLLSSSDVFALEWEDIKENHKILYGEDITERISVDKEHFRMELERKIKQLFLDFQQALIFQKDKNIVFEETIKNLNFLIPFIEKQLEKRIDISGLFEKEKIEIKVDKLLKFLSDIILLVDENLKERR